ncbi:MAG: ATP-grasp domain-containing protein [Armatimonadota bacterium]
MLILFCCDPLNCRRVDSDYQAEYDAACDTGLLQGLINYEELIAGNVARSVAQVPEGSADALYRGWMLTPEQYGAMYVALRGREVRLITSPEAYRHCHYLPESYPLIREMTADTVWVPATSPDLVGEAVKLLGHFGDRPVIIKDYVKSQKHAWEEACYIPCASDIAQAEQVIRRFLELQDEDLQGGLVIREYVPLEMLTTHSRSGMPLAMEYRIFFYRREPLQVYCYWEEGEYGEELPDITPFLPVARRVESPFFTMDVAKRADGGWMIVELGDGQVAGLPELADVRTFYRKIAEAS